MFDLLHLILLKFTIIITAFSLKVKSMIHGGRIILLKRDLTLCIHGVYHKD